MKNERPVDRRNRKWRSLRNPAILHVRVSQRAKAILSALRKGEVDQIGYGEVIEKLAEQHANVLGPEGRRIEECGAQPPAGVE